MSTALFIALLAPVLLWPLVTAAEGRLRQKVGWLALLGPVISVVAVASLIGPVAAGEGGEVVVSWIPSLDLELRFMVDGLAVFFGLIVSGMGVLVFFYAAFYLDDHYEFHGRFYGYLLLFMAAMLVTVFSGNLLLLFIAWELTGITSFLLIGFLHGKEVSRDGARMALLVTASTGLVMLAGVVLLGQLAGTYNIAELAGGALAGADRGQLTVAFCLIAVGAMGKSAQFPFHFWLPNAMAAPTPVSAYLHSATMVKLGVFLVARIFPLFAGLELWTPGLATVAFGTMLLASVLALLSHDLKAVLAYSTVMTLGFLIGWYGLGKPGGVQDDFLHIIGHVFYKGCLFMVVGIIDHATHERDLRKLGGMRLRMPLLAVIAAIAAASMAGIPGTTGFISKEYMLKGLYRFAADGGWTWFPLIAAVIASVVKVIFSARIVWAGFGGAETPAVGKHFHAPTLGLQLAPLALVVAVVLFGLFPGVLGHGLQALATTGLHTSAEWHYSLWHGVTKEFMTSVIIVVGGLGIYFAVGRAGWDAMSIPRWLRFDTGFEAGVKALPDGAKWLSEVAFRSQRPFDYGLIVLSFFLVVVGGYAATQVNELWPTLPGVEDFSVLRVVVVVLTILATMLVISAKRWMTQLMALSIIGLFLTFYFVLLQAPDLAMTQILVETATLILVLLLLARFPRSAEEQRLGERAWNGRKMGNILVSLGMGGLVTGLALVGQRPRDFVPAGDYFLENTVPLAKGTNAVNTILVDFRGFDTLMEVTVLVIATMGAVGLFMRYRRTPAELAAREMGPGGFGVRSKRASQRSEGVNTEGEA